MGFNNQRFAIFYYRGDGQPIGYTAYRYDTLPQALVDAQNDAVTGTGPGIASGRILPGLFPKDTLSYMYISDDMTSMFERLDVGTGLPYGPL